MCVQNGQLSRFVKDVRKSDYRRDREDSRGKERHYEHSRSQKDRRQDYEWKRGSRPGEGTSGGRQVGASPLDQTTL